jgi:hypothetical protein
MKKIQTYVVARTALVDKRYKRSLGQVLNATDYIIVWQRPGLHSTHFILHIPSYNTNE